MLPPSDPRNTRALTETREQTRTRLHAKFKVHFSESAKAVARRVGQSPETVEIYKQSNIPQAWAQFAEYCRANPAFAVDVLEELGINIDQDRNAYVLFLQLQKQVRGE